MPSRCSARRRSTPSSSARSWCADAPWRGPTQPEDAPDVSAWQQASADAPRSGGCVPGRPGTEATVGTNDDRVGMADHGDPDWFDVVVPTIGRDTLHAVIQGMAAGPGPWPRHVIVVDDRPGRRP